MAYTEPEKAEARRHALTHAVELLTTRRAAAAVVPRDHVRTIKAYLLKKKDDRSAIADSCDDRAITLWEGLWEATIGARRPGDLVVAYLAGPEPLNDFRALVELGVHPNNIFAFEAEKGVFNDALTRIRDSEFPLLKLHFGTLERYLQSVPRRFDIIYVDACGPLPSRSQRTLSLIATIFRYQRLASPGVLITNFAQPDLSITEDLDAYSELIAAYLWPKAFLESGKPDWNLDDGAESHGLICRNDENLKESFFHRVRNNFEWHYSQFITRVLFDLGSFISALVRLTNSEIWSTFFTKQPRDVAKIAEPLRTIDEDGAFATDPSMHALAWTLTALPDKEPLSGDYPPLVADGALRKIFRTQLAGLPLPTYDAMTSVYAYEALRSRHDGAAAFANDAFVKMLVDFGRWRERHLFCDAPTRELALFPVLAQYAYPMHCNVLETQRRTYIAQGKRTRMFMDVMPFDECRYLYDWLPSLHTMEGSAANSSHELVFRLALDGLAKQKLRHSSEYLYGANVVGVIGDDFVESLFRPREGLKAPEALALEELDDQIGSSEDAGSDEGVGSDEDVGSGEGP
ncbi:hypothetical protein ACSRUE_32470 [Sorangium sp. KYC3313]|uniref:hypothetical protein n=1 Tax=Sorangium sp. KYC3313 TaxID=3449740 RepID=UPI003F8C64A7